MSAQATTAENSRDSTEESINAEILQRESRNLITLVVHQLALRVAWIFKTESVIMPAFMDVISGAGWMRGCLPVLNQATQGVVPIFFAPVLRNAKQKKWALVLTTLAMAIPFLILATLVWRLSAEPHAWLPYIFLLLYTIFFAASGLNQLSSGTISGKLIRANRRGRLMAISGLVGSLAAIVTAWNLLPTWLSRADRGFWLVFGFTGCGMLIAALLAGLISEPSDPPRERLPVRTNPFRNAARLIRADADMRRLILVCMLFMSGLLLFPHYQKLGKSAADYSPARLMVWVVAQNGGAGLLSMFTGMIADRYGNRLALRLGILGTTLTPFVALALSNYAPGSLYWLTFLSLGWVPTTLKTIINYTLELTDSSQHPQYISTVRMCIALPLLLSPIVGWLIEPQRLGFPIVFCAISCVTLLGVLMTFRMIEPRTAKR